MRVLKLSFSTGKGTEEVEYWVYGEKGCVNLQSVGCPCRGTTEHEPKGCRAGNNTLRLSHHFLEGIGIRNKQLEEGVEAPGQLLSRQ